jgi:hypothetical protein
MGFGVRSVGVLVMVMDFSLERLRSAKRALFVKFVTETISETAKVAITTTASLASPMAGPVLGSVAGVVSKEFLETLLKRTSEVEKKLDILLLEPFLTGLQLLLEANVHPGRTPEELASRDAILHASHVSFVRAHSLIVNSREDSAFVRTLDCLALSSHRGRMTVAASVLAEVEVDIHLLKQHVKALEASATEWINDAKILNAFFGRGDEGAKPFGYVSQVAVAKRYEKKGKKLDTEAKEARHRLSVLESIVAVARNAIHGSSDSVSKNSTAL